MLKQKTNNNTKATKQQHATLRVAKCARCKKSEV